jgi:hypothetical protein
MSEGSLGPLDVDFCRQIQSRRSTARSTRVSRPGLHSFESAPQLRHARASAHQREGIIKHALDAFHSGVEKTLGRLDEAVLTRVATLLADSRRPAEDSSRRAASRGGVTGVTTFTFRGVCQDREYVIAGQAREILQDLILTHTARQIFENIGRRNPSAQNAGLAAAYTGSDLNILLPIHECLPVCAQCLIEG